MDGDGITRLLAGKHTWTERAPSCRGPGTWMRLLGATTQGEATVFAGGAAHMRLLVSRDTGAEPAPTHGRARMWKRPHPSAAALLRTRALIGRKARRQDRIRRWRVGALLGEEAQWGRILRRRRHNGSLLRREAERDGRHRLLQWPRHNGPLLYLEANRDEADLCWTPTNLNRFEGGRSLTLPLANPFSAISMDGRRQDG